MKVRYHEKSNRDYTTVLSGKVAALLADCRVQWNIMYVRRRFKIVAVVVDAAAAVGET